MVVFYFSKIKRCFAVTKVATTAKVCGVQQESLRCYSSCTVVSCALCAGLHQNNTTPPTNFFHLRSTFIIITCWIRYCTRRRSWPDFVWSLSLPRLAILFDHMHPLSPVHFSSSHSPLAFSTFVSVFLYHRLLQILKPMLSHSHLLSSKHDRTTAYYLL